LKDEITESVSTESTIYLRTVSEKLTADTARFVSQWGKSNQGANRGIRTFVHNPNIKLLISEDSKDSYRSTIKENLALVFDELVSRVSNIPEWELGDLPVADFSNTVRIMFPKISMNYYPRHITQEQFVSRRVSPDNRWKLVVDNIPVMCNISGRLPAALKAPGVSKFGNVQCGISFGAVLANLTKDGVAFHTVCKNCLTHYCGPKIDNRRERSRKDVISFAGYEISRERMINFAQGRAAEAEKVYARAKSSNSGKGGAKPGQKTLSKTKLTKNSKCPMCATRGVLKCEETGCGYLRTVTG
jgi:hypothetical protein